MSDFFNIAGMIEYMNRLKDFVDNTILLRKEKLNNLCECCQEKEIEVEWRPVDFCDEFYEDDVKKYKININFFCESCYNILLEREEIVPGEFTIFYKEKKEEI